MHNGIYLSCLKPEACQSMNSLAWAVLANNAVGLDSTGVKGNQEKPLIKNSTSGSASFFSTNTSLASFILF